MAHVLPVYSQDGLSLLGGGERYVLELARALSQRCDLTLVTFGSRHDEDMVEGIRHIVMPAIHRSEINPIPLPTRPFKGRFDVVHVFQLQTVVASLVAGWCRVKNIPLVVTDLGGGGRNPMNRWKLHRWISRGIAISEHSRQLLPEGLKPRTVVVKGGVDSGRFTYYDGARRRQVAQIGRIMPHKGINYLIDAAGDDIEVVIAGRVVDERYFDLLRSKAMGKRVQFVLDPTDREVEDLYRTSAVTVSASVYEDIYGVRYPQSELLGLTMLESMATGTPVVCSAVGGMPEYVEDGKTGFIVEPGDPQQLRRRLKQLLGDPAGARMMGGAGCKAVTGYSWARVAEQVRSEYQGLGRSLVPAPTSK